MKYLESTNTKMKEVPKESVWKQIVTVIPVYNALFMIGCGSGWFSNAVYYLLEDKEEEMHATSSQCASIASLHFLGKILFAIPAGILTDRYGRRKIIISVAVLLVFCWSAIILNNQLFTIYASRFIAGIAGTMISTTSMITIGEIASPEIRGRLTSIGLIVMHIGIVSPSIISVVFSSYKTLTWGVTFFSIVTLLPTFWAIETPSFLVSLSKLDQAKQVLQSIRPGHLQKEIDTEFEKLRTYIQDERTHKSEISWMRFIKSKSVRRPLITGIMVTCFTSLMGISVIKAYNTVIIPSNDFVPKKYYPLINQIVSFFISLNTTFYIDKFPRRILHLCGASTMVIVNVLCAYASYFIAQDRYEGVFKSIFTMGNILLLVCYSALIQPMSNALSSELYPQAVKGFCGSIVLMCEASSSISIHQFYGFINQYFKSHLYLMYVIFSISAFFLSLVVYFIVPEGRGMFLTDLQVKFKDDPLLPRRSHLKN